MSLVDITCLVRFEMFLLPYNQDNLGNSQDNNEDYEHLSMHHIMSSVLGMHSSMLLSPLKLLIGLEMQILKTQLLSNPYMNKINKRRFI